MNNNFVSLATFTSKDEVACLAQLSDLYNNYDLLFEKTEHLVLSHINKSDIGNKKILLKPNWVRDNIAETDKICLCTNENVILALTESLLKIKPTSIIIGDAPIQGCDWSKLLSSHFYTKVKILSEKYNTPIFIKDFRKVCFNPATNLMERNNNDSDYIIFDLGSKSFLEEITSKKNTFRVTCYDPDRMKESHRKGMHKYCLTKEVFDCDTIITIPKIKTHQKAGLTNSLKILVGINGDKDYLPHHRIGAIGHGGDCYKGWHPLRRMSELVLDKANRHRGDHFYRPLSYLSAALWRLSFPKPSQNLAAGWYGNDTVWRMVLDLNHIAIYGRRDGTITEKKQRTIYTLCDGIIGGQGNGPLSPDPLPLGILAFSNDSFAMDEVAGLLFKLNMDKIPLLHYACKTNEHKNIKYFLNDIPCRLEDYTSLSKNVIMPPGWIDYEQKK